MMDNLPLVSIIVITYNSSKYVLETLESAKAQTYQNIELIVSDDCSTDNTVEICQKWISENKERFVRTELITTDKNTGISANCNRAIKAAKGEWLKGIAGDDILLPNCIKDNVVFIMNNPEAKLVHSRALIYMDTFEDFNFMAKSSTDIILTEQFAATEQFTVLSFKNSVFSPTVFIDKEVLRNYGYDESIPLCEDWSLFLNLTQNGIKFYFLDSNTVRYRLHKQSVLRSKDFFVKTTLDIYQKWIKEYSNKYFHFMFMYHFYVNKIIYSLKLNNKLDFIIFKLRDLLDYPFSCYYKFVKKNIISKVHRKC